MRPPPAANKAEKITNEPPFNDNEPNEIATLEVVDEPDGDTPRVWRHATIFGHKTKSNDVLWFGGDDYEGIGGECRWESTSQKLLDSDGTETRSHKAKNSNRPAGRQGKNSKGKQCKKK